MNYCLRLLKILMFISLLSFLTMASAKDKSSVKAGDYINMAAMLVKDGLYQRAILALQNIDINDEKLDLSRFYTLQGLAYLNLKDLMAAKQNLEKAIENGQTDPVVYVYLAQSNYGLKDYQGTIDAVNKAGNSALTHPSILEMQIQSYWQLKNYEQAFLILNQAQTLFPNEHRFTRRKVFYLVDLQLYRQAANLGLIYLRESNAQAKDYIAIGNALRLSRQFPEALSILESARLKFPQDSTIAKVLAHTYLDQGHLNTAAQIFEQGALYDQALYVEAGEIYRRAGRYYRALNMNAKIADQKVKLKQRLAIFLALKRYEAAVNMKVALYRQGLIQDENIRYALAYAYFNIGRFKESQKQLSFLKNPELFKKGIELRRIMNECLESPAQCV